MLSVKRNSDGCGWVSDGMRSTVHLSSPLTEIAQALFRLYFGHNVGVFESDLIKEGPRLLDVLCGVAVGKRNEVNAVGGLEFDPTQSRDQIDVARAEHGKVDGELRGLA